MQFTQHDQPNNNADDVVPKIVVNVASPSPAEIKHMAETIIAVRSSEFSHILTNQPERFFIPLSLSHSS